MSATVHMVTGESHPVEVCFPQSVDTDNTRRPLFAIDGQFIGAPLLCDIAGAVEVGQKLAKRVIGRQDRLVTGMLPQIFEEIFGSALFLKAVGADGAGDHPPFWRDK